MSYKYIIYEKDGALAKITFNQPDKLNALGLVGRDEDAAEFYDALEDTEKDDDVKVVIIKGAGRAFSVGHDLKKVGFVYGFGTGKGGEQQRPSQRIRLRKDRMGLADDLLKIFLCSKITIAQVHGYCIAAGLDIALMCDLTIAADDTILGRPEQRLGFAGCGFPSFQIMVAMIGLKRTVDLVLTGRQVSAAEAEQMGLITKSVPKEKLSENVEKLAKALCLLPKDGIAIGKAMRHQIYSQMGLTNLVPGYVSHTLFTNLQWAEGEFNFFKERRDESTKAAFHKRDELWADALKGIYGSD